MCILLVFCLMTKTDCFQKAFLTIFAYVNDSEVNALNTQVYNCRWIHTYTETIHAKVYCICISLNITPSIRMIQALVSAIRNAIRYLLHAFIYQQRACSKELFRLRFEFCMNWLQYWSDTKRDSICYTHSTTKLKKKSNQI